MNISRLKELMKFLPDSFDPTELKVPLLTELCDELDETLSELRDLVRAADEAELQATLERAATLQAKLGIPPMTQSPTSSAPPASNTRAREPEHDITDSERGGDDENDGETAASFRAEMLALRDRTAAKRRRLS